MTALSPRVAPRTLRRVRTVRIRSTAFTLLELALVLSLIGVTLAVMVPAFTREVRVSKLAEASETLQALHRAVASYYTTPRSTASGLRIECIPAPAGPTPAEPSPDPVRVDFQAAGTPGAATWRALGFQPPRPIRYRYTLSTEHPGCAADPGTSTVLLRAEGDLDGDERYSRFERVLVARDGELAPSMPALVVDRTE